jgi:hypothetical protein
MTRSDETAVPERTNEPQSTPRPDFARGQERDPDAATRREEDRFSKGQERRPKDHEKVHEGDFAEGQADDERHPEGELPGRFARGQQDSDPGSPNAG